MMEQTEFLWHTLCFTPFWGCVDAILILHFFLSWYRSAKKTGWKVDFWYLTLALSIFPSICLLYPFNASVHNLPFTRGNYLKIIPLVDWAFAISVLGYVSLWLGRYIFDLSAGKFALIAPFRLVQPLCQLIENNIKSQKAYLYLCFFALGLGMMILGIQFCEGSFFNARAYFLQNPVLRPLFNATVSILPIACVFLSLRYTQFQEKHCLKYIIFLFLISIFFGVRSLALGGLFFLISNLIFYRQGRFSFMKLFALGSALFICAVLLGNLREGHFNLLHSLGYFAINLFYGNNFSDTRDFAWILAYWDGEYLYGKTYFAALISFIPRALSSIREEWSISMFTNALTGFDSEVMPGLRPGFFGEMFLNFSYFGVVCFGLFFGFSLRYADAMIKEQVTRSKDLIKGYSHLLLFSLASCLSVSASLWSFYLFLLVNLALVLVRGPIQKSPITSSQT